MLLCLSDYPLQPRPCSFERSCCGFFAVVVMNTGSVWMCVCVRLPWFSLFASGLGMKGPGGLVREERADVSWPVGTWFSRITLPSQAGFGSTLTRSHSFSCLSPIPLLLFPQQLRSLCLPHCVFMWICVLVMC